MLRLLSDENFNGNIVRGWLSRVPALDIVRAQDAGLQQTPDPDILAWCAANNRILLTHDRTTVPPFAYARMAASEPVDGVIVVDDHLPIGQAIDELVMMDVCSETDEYRDRVVFVPLP